MQIRAKWKNLQGPGTLEMTLPPALRNIALLIPGGIVQADGRILWLNVPGPSGSISARVVTNAAAASGEVLSITGKLTDANNAAVQSTFVSTVR